MTAAVALLPPPGQRAHLVYLAGAPAAGKSAVAAHLGAGCWREPGGRPPLPHELLRHPGTGDVVAAEIGRRTGRTPWQVTGSDVLGAHEQVVACRWVQGRPWPLLLVEGALLGTSAFLDACRAGGYRVHLVHVTCDPQERQRRLAHRPRVLSSQWLAGLAGRAHGLVAYARRQRWPVTEVDTTAARAGDVAARLRATLAPLEALDTSR